ncbi:uroporphyrinogen-III synthase [Rubellimicrobium arenae]|uniref:uroporphyrinogen-III synthase n=1 Tax=Rubellimicrobium arenae TaxID=2817372 RepID=UPI001B31733B|nr:uroporphyrinogen-III synthase [Rubellimicrobium arenae]
MNGAARLLLTRPQAASERLLDACEAVWGRPIPAIISPVMAIQPRAVDLPERPDGLILTSEHGARRAGALGLAGLPAWCVGRRTADVAAAEGLQARVAGQEAEELVERLLTERPSGLLLHLRGEHARGNIAARLNAAGLCAGEAVAYSQEALPPTPEAHAALQDPDPLVVPLFSPRSATLLAAWTPAAPLDVIALSDAVAQAAGPLRPASLVTAAGPNGTAMVQAILDRFTGLQASGLRGAREQIR